MLITIIKLHSLNYLGRNQVTFIIIHKIKLLLNMTKFSLEVNVNVSSIKERDVGDCT